MKSIKRLVFATLLAVGAFGAVLYTSCNKDKCKDVACQNGGTCNDGVCTCQPGYEGANCETQSRSKFTAKTWNATDVVGTTTLSYTGNISNASGTDVTQVVIGNTFSDNFFTIGTIKATVNDSLITIPLQNPDNNKYSLSGSGILVSGKITWSYTIKNDSTSATQIYSAIWQ